MRTRCVRSTSYQCITVFATAFTLELRDRPLYPYGFNRGSRLRLYSSLSKVISVSESTCPCAQKRGFQVGGVGVGHCLGVGVWVG